VGKILRERNELEQHLIMSDDDSYNVVYDRYVMKSAFQPIVSLSGKLFGYEALLRVFDEAGDQLLTEPFFTSELLTERDRINIDRLAKVIHLRNFSRFLSCGTLFLNMSPASVIDGDTHVLTKHSLIPRVTDLGLSIDQIYFEVLEHFCSNDSRLVQSLQSMRRQGLQIAIDDYGVGASSELRAREVKPEIIKMDKSLLAEYINGEPDKLLKAMELASELDAKVLLEGVEDHRCFEAAQALGVDYMQGYYIGRPELVQCLSRKSELAYTQETSL